MASALSILKALTRLETCLAAVAYAGVVLILVAEVIAVDVFSTALWGSQQVAVLCGIVACMLGLTLATGQSAHFRPLFTDWMIPNAWADRVGDLISAVLFAVFFFFAVQFVLQSHAFSDRVPVINILLWPVQLVVPYVLASCAFKHAVFACAPRVKDVLAERPL